MDDLTKLPFQSDLVNLIYLPFIFVTIRDVAGNWSSLTDDELTQSDRTVLKQATIFLLLPCIVFLHEMGHFLAAVDVGAKVIHFHYGFVTGFVSIVPDRSPAQLLWIAFAGNLVQIVTGVIFLIGATITRSPWVVALLVYFGLFSIADTALFYAALSAVGLYGDWREIYTSTDRAGVFAIGVFHATMLILLTTLWSSHTSRYWFARKTMPGWYQLHRLLEQQAAANPDYISLEALCVSWLKGGFPAKAENVLQKMAELGDRPQIKLLRGRIMLTRGEVQDAMRCFLELINDPALNSHGRARLCVEAGELLSSSREFAEALNLFSKASELDPQLGEPRLFKAIMLNSNGKFQDALHELSFVSDPETEWMSPGNQVLAREEAERARAALNQGV